MEKVQSIRSSSGLLDNLDFDREQLYNKKTGKTICDTDSKSFEEILKGEMKRNDKGI